jgi:hypothetical protein
MTASALLGTGRRHAACVAALPVFLALLFFVPSCSRVPKPAKEPGQRSDRKTSPQEYLDAARESLRRRPSATITQQHDRTYALEALDNLNRYVKAQDIVPPLLDKQDVDWLKHNLKLEEGSLNGLLNVIQSPAYTPADALYLELCLQVGDAAQALDLGEWPVLDRARLAFAWVVRHVALKERARLVDDNWIDDTPLPLNVPQMAGQGTARERALIFLALLRQLGIEGCLLVIPDEKAPTFWQVGVLIDKQAKDPMGAGMTPGIYLFDTRLGIPLPGPGGTGIARLDQVLQSPEATRGQFDKAIARRIIPDEVAKTRVVVLCPLVALAPRMKLLEEKLGIRGKYVVADDPSARKEAQRRFAEAARGLTVALSPRLDGVATRAEEARVVRMFSAMMGPIPLWQVKFPEELHPAFFPMLNREILKRYNERVNAPRGLVIQGRIETATKQLLDIHGVLVSNNETYLATIRSEEQKAALQHDIDEWCKKVRDLAVKIMNAREDAHRDPARDPELAEARQEWAGLESGPVPNFVLLRATAEVFGRECTYLLCECMQEKAEQLEIRLARLRDAGDKEALARANQEAREAWGNARRWWDTFFAAENRYGLTVPLFKSRLRELRLFLRPRDKSQATIAPGLYEQLALDLSRSVGARLMQARACAKAGVEGGAALLEQQARDFESLEKSGHLATFQRCSRELSTVRDGCTSPDNVVWLRATLAFHIQRLKKMP